MKSKIAMITDLITGLDLTPNESYEIVKFVMNQGGFCILDFCPEIKTRFENLTNLIEAQTEVLKNLAQPQKFDDKAEVSVVESVSQEEISADIVETKLEAKISADVVEVGPENLEVTPYNVPNPKRVSKTGKPLGRPKKVKAEISISEQSSIKEEVAQEKIEKKVVKFIPEKIVQEKRRLDILPSEDNFESLKMGKVLSLALMYKIKSGYVRSDKVLNGLNPEGIYIPYKFGGEEFVLSLTNEPMGINLKDAISYAKTKQKINDKSWMVLTPQQNESAKSKLSDLNEILKKVGGDAFEGGYFTNPSSYSSRIKDKIRLAIEV